jgi:hypothetical protein
MKVFPHLAILALAVTTLLPTRAAAQPPDVSQRSLLGGAPDTAFAVVHLRDDTGTCTVLHKTDTVKASRSKKFFVEFVVVNDCAAAVWVSVTGFAHYTNPGAADPFSTPAGDRRRMVPANQVSNNLRLRIRNDAVIGSWIYNLRINDGIVDPKIDIDQ